MTVEYDFLGVDRGKITVLKPEEYEFPSGLLKDQVVVLALELPDGFDVEKSFTVRLKTSYDETWAAYDLSRMDELKGGWWRGKKVADLDAE